MLEANQSGRTIPAERLREAVEEHQYILVDYFWVRRRWQKENGIADWPEEQCQPPVLTAGDLAERRRLVESVLALVEGTPDEQTRHFLEDYCQGGDDRVGIVLHDLLRPAKETNRSRRKVSSPHPVPPPLRERLKREP